MADNSSHSYPWVLWRNVSVSRGGGTGFEWAPTHLHKFFAAWRDVDGDRFQAKSDEANVQVHGFAASGNWTVALNNLNHTAPVNVSLEWPAPLAGGPAASV